VYKKILLPTDGSEESKKAVSRGLELAKALGSDVVGVYVIDTSSFVSLPETFMWENVRGLLEEEGKKAIASMERAAKKHKLKLSSEIREGRPSKEILNSAAEKKADLIVMGTAAALPHWNKISMWTCSRMLEKSADCIGKFL
jgi:nucleotide-binding universal stress UspA family protein